MENFYKKRMVLVTGGAGFIGSHLCEKLVALGAYVRVLDNMETGSYANLDAIKADIEFIHGSVTDIHTAVQACQEIETVFHLAAVVSVAASQNNPHFCLETNVQGSAHILEAARLNGCQRVIFASSAAVYGNHEGLCTEETQTNPVSTYGYSKKLGEELCQLYANCYELETVCLRYFNVYGPRQNHAAGNGGVVAVLNHKIVNNEPITIFGDGQQTRDFIHVNDVVKATLKAGMLNARYADGQPFNIATGTSITLQSKLEELLQQHPEYQQPVSYLPDRPGDIKHSQADCSKFQKALL